jgi:hypothetical protein
MSVATITPTIAQNSVVNGAHFVSKRWPVKRTPVRSALCPTVLSVASRVAIRPPFLDLKREDAREGALETAGLRYSMRYARADSLTARRGRRGNGESRRTVTEEGLAG